MIKEALQYFKELADKDRYRLVEDGAVSKIYLDFQSGEQKAVAKLSPAVRSEVYDIESLLEFSEDQAFIFVSEDSIQLVLDNDGMRSDRVIMPLTVSPIYDCLKSPITGNPKAVIDHLRFSVCRMAQKVHPEDILAKLSVLKFEIASEESHAVRPRDEGVSKSFKAKVSGEANAEIPEEMAVEFHMYPDLNSQMNPEIGDTSVKIRLAIQIDPTEGRFTIRPFPGEMRAAQISAIHDIQGCIQNKSNAAGSTVVLGKPDSSRFGRFGNVS